LAKYHATKAESAKETTTHHQEIADAEGNLPEGHAATSSIEIPKKPEEARSYDC